ncbi:aminoglycoside phosphotransferase family protein [Parerythrobacter jejuensis]|uniref:Phosphotransferase n=1 Tax=Parerythrobacter jejuensis TaxID=795812 RepID=A0A845AZI4_9SPHN|nr:phosphotransferase [Parerythrobacter jejuensis]MXP32158.1 phosphotransferase [Parerythrobacter jejuensis]
MTSADKVLPEGGIEFLDRAGWGGCAINPIPGDASDRRYFRLNLAGEGALLMHSPPPGEDPRPFLHVGHWLNENRLRAPQIMAEDADAGWILLEDFGNDRMRDWLDDNPAGEEGAYGAAIDALVPLHRLEPGPFAPYDMPTYLREARLFTEWYCPAQNLAVDDHSFDQAWNEALTPLIERQRHCVTVLRDYHAENIMLLGPAPDGTGPQGIIDFQDALVGHPAYDLVSLLQDARRDVDPALERRMLDRYLAQVDAGEHFEADYALLGAQRNAKIVGIFTRLFRRDGKARYPAFIPRVWDALERDLEHPALGPVANWFDENVPPALREAKGGSIT